MSKFYPELAAQLNTIYSQYQDSLNTHTQQLAQKTLKLSQIQAEIDRIHETAKTEISFLKKKLTDLSLSIYNQEDTQMIEQKLIQEISEAQFLLSDQKQREASQIAKIEELIIRKQQTLDEKKGAYQTEIQHLMGEIHEKQMLAGELSGLHSRSFSHSDE
eukprot:EST49030.1 Hypothetical protein SS50377_10728 [Spironucleus salmonicida]